MSYAVGEFGLLHPTPAYGWSVIALDFVPIAVDADGTVHTTGGGGGGGTVDQGAAGVSSWLVSVTNVPHVIIDSATLGNVTVVQPTGSNLHVQLDAGAAAIGTVTANQGGAPWSQNLTQVNSQGVNVGTGTAGTGTQRVSVSSDSVQDDRITSGSLTALDTTVQVDVRGYKSCGAWIPTSTAFLNVTVEASGDGGANWVTRVSHYTVPGLSSAWNSTFTLLNPNNGILEVPVAGSDTHIRVRASSFVSGPQPVTMRASNLTDFMVRALGFDGVSADSLKAGLRVGGVDTSTTHRTVIMGTGVPSVLDYGFVVREGTRGSATSANSVPVVPASDYSVGATVIATDGDAAYTAAQTGKAITETTDGRLRTTSAGLVTNTMPAYVNTTVKTLTLTPDGSLRAATADDNLRRIDELNLIENMKVAMDALIASESETSHRMGFELR